MIDNKIFSRQNKRVIYACSLKNEKERTANDEFLLEGRLALEMGLAKGLVKEIFTTKELDSIPSNVVVNLVDQKVMDKLSEEKTPEGIVFICKIPHFEDKDYQKIIYLDRVRDPGNLGTIVRTALGLGIDAIYISKESVSVFNNKTLAAAKGAIFEIPIFVKEVEEVRQLKNKGYQIISTSLKGKTVSLDEFKAKKPLVCIFGNETHGIREELLKLSDVYLKIPIEKIDSFNVAISSAIVMYNLKD